VFCASRYETFRLREESSILSRGKAILVRERGSGQREGRLKLAARTKLIVNLTRGECLCVGVLADRPLRRMRGLMGQQALPAGEGLLLSPAPAIHTAFMRFPIDALFLDRNLRVLDVRERLGPWRVASKPKARAVLELSAGECARRGVEVGDQLGLRERKPVAAGQAAATKQAHALKSSESIIWPAALERLGELGGRQAMRVLVISRDRHFRSVTSMLLSHRGCSVSATAKSSGVAELINRDRADVVVVDAGQSPASVQAIAAAAAFVRSVGIVVVDETSSDSQRPPVLAKWGPFEQLFGAIEQAAQDPGSWRGSGATG
jgi:uncharacterized protein